MRKEILGTKKNKCASNPIRTSDLSISNAQHYEWSALPLSYGGFSFVGFESVNFG